MTKRKKRAQIIAGRQEYAEKRNRLQNVLVQKLLLKYGPNTEHALSKRQITHVVDSYIGKTPSIVHITSIRNVEDLESILSDELRYVQKREIKPRKVSNKDLNTDSDIEEMKNGLEKNLTEPQLRYDGEKDILRLNTKNLNPWTLIETFQIVKNEQAIETKKIEATRKKRDMAMALHEQIRMKKAAAKEEKDEDDKFLAIQRKSIKEWKDEQELNSIKEKQKIAELKKVRQQQVEEAEKKRKEEKSEKMSRELKEIETIKSALEKEEEEKQNRKRMEREKWDRITAENSKKLEQRRLKKKEEAEMEVKLMTDMKKKYDDEEKKRAKALENRKVKLEVNGELLKEAGAFSQREEMIKLEKKLLEAADARERAEALVEKKKRDLERKKKELITSSNKKMTEEKRRREREIEKENEEFALKCMKEKELLLHEEETTRIKQHETKEKYRRNLQAQMDEQKKNRTHFDGMTLVERSMNKKLMKELESDNNINSDVIEKVMEKLRAFNYVSDQQI